MHFNKIKYTPFILPDLHSPYHDKPFFSKILDAIKLSKPSHIIIIGDLVDFYTLSKFTKSMAMRLPATEEIKIANRILDKISAIAKDIGAEVVFIMGNHEERFNTYILQNSPALEGLVSLRNELKMPERGWTFIEYREDAFKLGKIHFLHDIARFGKYAAHQSITDYGEPLVIGHTHRLGIAYGGTVCGRTIPCMMVGHGCDIKRIDYRHKSLVKRDWVQGCGQVAIDYSGHGWVYCSPLVRGKLHVFDTWGKILRSKR